jgi:hypothetical protein
MIETPVASLNRSMVSRSPRSALNVAGSGRSSAAASLALTRCPNCRWSAVRGGAGSGITPVGVRRSRHSSHDALNDTISVTKMSRASRIGDARRAGRGNSYYSGRRS